VLVLVLQSEAQKQLKLPSRVGLDPAFHPSRRHVKAGPQAPAISSTNCRVATASLGTAHSSSRHLLSGDYVHGGPTAGHSSETMPRQRERGRACRRCAAAEPSGYCDAHAVPRGLECPPASKSSAVLRLHAPEASRSNTAPRWNLSRYTSSSRGAEQSMLRRVQYWYGVWVYSLNLWLSTVVRTGHSSAPHTLVFCQ
jgi:hypothetical protein